MPNVPRTHPCATLDRVIQGCPIFSTGSGVSTACKLCHVESKKTVPADVRAATRHMKRLIRIANASSHDVQKSQCIFSSTSDVPSVCASKKQCVAGYNVNRVFAVGREVAAAAEEVHDFGRLDRAPNMSGIYSKMPVALASLPGISARPIPCPPARPEGRQSPKRPVPRCYV